MVPYRPSLFSCNISKKKHLQASPTVTKGKLIQLPTRQRAYGRSHTKYELGLDKFKSGREGNNVAKKTINILDLGEQRLKSSTLATFNKKVQCLHDGLNDEEVELDIDTIPAVAINFGTEENGEEN